MGAERAHSGVLSALEGEIRCIEHVAAKIARGICWLSACFSKIKAYMTSAPSASPASSKADARARIDCATKGLSGNSRNRRSNVSALRTGAFRSSSHQALPDRPFSR